jgi:N-acetylmuramoyl-L-alanine amidase
MTRRLRESHADVVIADSIDAHQHAMTANSFDARVYVGLAMSDVESLTVSYFETDRFVSELGRSLANSLTAALGPVLSPRPVIASGARLTVLRETRMTAVVVDLGELGGGRSPEAIGELLGSTLAQWLETPANPDS